MNLGRLRIIAAAAAFLTPLAASAAELLDILIGHEDGRSRIELLLTDAAAIEQIAAGEFRLRGVSATNITLDFGELHMPIAGLAVTPEGAGAARLALRLATDAEAEVYAGESGTGFRLYVDLRYAADPRFAAARAAAARKFAASGWPAGSGGASQAVSVAAADQNADSSNSAPSGAAQAARETASATDGAGRSANAANAANAERSAASRIAAPEPAAATPLETLRPPPRIAPISKTEFFDKAQAMLGADLSVEGCDQARAELRRNAWDMSALVGYGVCLVAEDRPDEADRVFRRLLSIEPTSFEANVGRALVAQIRGDRDEAVSAYRMALAAEAPSPDALAEIQSALAGLEDAS